MSHSDEEPLVTLLIRGGWVSPNVILGTSWYKKNKARKAIDEQVGFNLLQLDMARRSEIQLQTPKRRRLKFTVVQLRGVRPDPDNLVAGLKITIDALKKVQYQRVVAGYRKDGKKKYKNVRIDGPGIIWDDNFKWLDLDPVVDYRDDVHIFPEAKKFVFVDVFET